MRLAEAQEAFALLLRGRIDEVRAAVADVDRAAEVPEPVRTLLEAIPEARLELYQQLVRGAFRNPIDHCFARVQELVGADWYALCEGFRTSVEARHWDSNQLALEFPAYLEQVWIPAHPTLPAWLVDLAHYERVELEVFLAEGNDEPGDASLHRPKVNPTLHLVVFGWDIAGFVRAREADAPVEAPDEGQKICAVYRDPETLMCRFLNVSPLAALVLQHWGDGEASGVIAAALAPQLGIPAAQCLAQLETLAQGLARDGAVRLV